MGDGVRNEELSLLRCRFIGFGELEEEEGLPFPRFDLYFELLELFGVYLFDGLWVVDGGEETARMRGFASGVDGAGPRSGVDERWEFRCCFSYLRIAARAEG